MGKLKKAMVNAAAKVNLFGIRSREMVTVVLCTKNGEGFVDTALFS